MGKITLWVQVLLLLTFLGNPSASGFESGTKKISEIKVSARITKVACYGQETGAIELIIDGGSPPYIITWAGTSQTGQNLSGLKSGLYTVRVQDAQSSKIETFLVDQPEEGLHYDNLLIKETSCPGTNDGVVSIEGVAGGTAPYTYSIDGSGFTSTPSFQGLQAKDYIFTIKDAAGCTLTKDFTITQPAILAATASGFNISCNGAVDGKIEVTNFSGGSGSYQFSINKGSSWQDSPLYYNLAPGLFQVVVRDKVNPSCQTILNNNLSLSQPAALNAYVTSTNANCFGSLSGRINITSATGGSGTYQYSINNGSSWQDSGSFPNLGSGNYQVLMRDKAQNSCIKTLNTLLIITQPAVLQAIVNSTNISCSGLNDGKITLSNPTGGNGTYQYSINNGNSWQESVNFNGLAPGTYQVVMRDKLVQGCFVTLSSNLVLTQPAALSMAAPVVTPITCNGLNNGAITAGTMSGGNGGYVYSLNNASFQSSNTFSGLSAGSYTLFVKDSKGCAFQQQVEVFQPASISANITFQNVLCFGGNSGSITVVNPLGGSGSYQYQLGNGAWQTSATFSTLITGTYTISVRDAANTACIRTLPIVQIAQPASTLTATASATRTTTYGTATGTATVIPAGGTGNPYTYQWRRKNETTILQQTQTANNLVAGIYVARVTDANGCFVDREVTVIERVTAEIKAVSLCENTASTFRTSTFSVDKATVLGGFGNPANYTFVWNFGAGANAPVITGDQFKVSYSTGGDKTISLTVTDQANVSTTLTFPHYVGECFENCGSSQNYQMDPQSFYIGDKDGNPITGSNCSATTEKYLWFTILKSANGYALSVELRYAVNNGSSTSKRTAVGCFGEKTGTGSNQEWIQILPGRYRLFRVVANTTNPAQINWDCGENFKIEGLSMQFVTNSRKECGDTNNQSCIGLSDETEVSTPIVATATAGSAKCFGQASGSITINAQGGVRPYFYSINGNTATEYKTTSIFSNLPAGTYNNVWVKDNKGLTFKLPNVTIGQPAAALSSGISATQPICFGNTGSATASPTGGTSFTTGTPYRYLWNDPAQQTTSTAANLAPGNYTVTVTDANGCQTLQSINITAPAQLTVAQAGPNQNFNCGVNSTILNANIPTNGAGRWSIVSGNGGLLENATNPVSGFTGLQGSYTLRWTIANATNTCSNFKDVVITFAANCSTLDFDGIDDYITFGDSYKLNTGAFSLEAWVKLKSTNGIKTVLSKRNSKNLGAGGYDLMVNFGAPTFRWGNNSISTSHLLTTNRWYHLAVIYNGTTASLYVDGILLSNSNAGNSATNTNPFIIGAMYDATAPSTPQNHFHGWIEEVRIWKTALTEEQLQFMMNQRLDQGNPSAIIKGKILPMEVPGGLTYDKLDGYYQLIGDQVTAGETKDLAPIKVNGQVKNVLTKQENTAPLPYTSIKEGVWSDKTTWTQASVWDYPNALGINGALINWNIVQVAHNITSGGKDIRVLGLQSEAGNLTIGNPSEDYNEKNSGQSLTVTHYLSLKGNLILSGESQLIQTDINDPVSKQSIISILDPVGQGYLMRSQQGTASSYNYNYWSSPVIAVGKLEPKYSVGAVMMDGSSTPNYGLPLSFGNEHTFADQEFSTPRKISNYWINKFGGTANAYSEWKAIGSTQEIKVGEGYTMKGTSGNANVLDPQNYIFKGKPNNGTITLTIGKDQNYLIGNPYPSAMDSHEFILDNLKSIAGGRNTQNAFDGSLYFWDHFAGKSHILNEYVGGYAVLNLSGGVPAISVDSRINYLGNPVSLKYPERYIPVGQAFLINSAEEVDTDPTDAIIPIMIEGGPVIFKNSQRKFIREATENSTFLKPELNNAEGQKTAVNFEKIRLTFSSPAGYHRQILVGAVPNTTNGFDLGYDALLNEDNVEDMYWIQGDNWLVIQGVPNFEKEQKLPLGIKLKAKGEFHIKIEKLENLSDAKNIYLKDIALDSIHDLRKSSYKGIAEGGYTNNRFEIVFYKEPAIVTNPPIVTKPEPILPEGEEETEEGTTTLSLLYSGSRQEVQILNPEGILLSNFYIFDLKGNQLLNYRSNSREKEVRIPVRSYSSGVYIMKLYSDGNVVSKKIIINNK